MYTGYIAAMIRGLFTNAGGVPVTVVYGPDEDAPAAGGGEFRLDITSALDGDVLNEEKAAQILLNVHGEWKTVFGAPDGEVSIPGCVVLAAGGKNLGCYWLDKDIDSAEKRRAGKDAGVGRWTIPEKSALIAPRERAAVVKNRIALITGGAQGIGEEIVRNLAAAGALVFIADLNLEGAQNLAARINLEEKRTAAIALKVDVSSERSVEEMFAAVALKTGGLDICVSNAGVLKAGSVLEQELSDFRFVTDINYTGFFLVTKYAARLLRAQRRLAPDWKTDIIQINSKSGLEGSNKNGAYAGGKFGGIGLVESFALELVDYNIKVNAICPGNFLDGPLWSHPEKGLFAQYLRAGKVPGAKNVADVRSFYESKVPMKRGCTGKDLTRAIYYLVEQEYETGQALPVTGGQVMLH